MSKLTLPGLIDIHVHLRDPGQTNKEDFTTGTTAALAGGFTTVIDMPNNLQPTTSFSRLKNKMRIARQKTLCNIRFYFGSIGDNLQDFKKVYKLVAGLKLFLNQTTGNLIIEDINKLKKIYQLWPIDAGPILFHAEDKKVELAIKMVRKFHKKTHICHISSEEELKYVIEAKHQGLPVTCGVTPHHLFLTDNDIKRLKSFALMKPTLKTKKDQQFLWRNFHYFDVIESDHAPHTIDEKKSDKPPYGVPGLETTLPLLLQAESEKRITLMQILNLCYYNPARIFNLPIDYGTRIEIDLKKYLINNKNLKTKCGWSPFAGWKIRGKVKRVYFKNKKIFENDKILVKPGFSYEK